MDHGWLNAKNRQYHKSKVIVCCNYHALAGVCGMFAAYPTRQGAIGIYRPGHERRGKETDVLGGTDSDV